MPDGPEPLGKVHLSINVLPEQLKLIDSLAADRGTSRNAVVRWLLKLGLEVAVRESKG